MSDFVTVAQVGSIPPGQGSSFVVGGKMIAVFNMGDQYHAIDDSCPHMGASLGAGAVDTDGTVTCPWHAWRFCVYDGKWLDNPRLSVKSYEVRVLGSEIQVNLAKE